MSRKAMLTLLFTLVLCGALFLIYLTIKKISAKEIIAKKVSTLSTVNLLGLDSTTFKIPTDKNVVLVFFNPGCEHCQYEAMGIRENIKDFKNATLVFLSSEPLNAIRHFSTQYDLDHFPFVHFTKINNEEVFDTFGTLSVPHIFIYGEDRKLIKEFKGETKIEAILKYIP